MRNHFAFVQMAIGEYVMNTKVLFWSRMENLTVSFSAEKLCV
jgi:hypothetical protein